MDAAIGGALRLPTAVVSSWSINGIPSGGGDHSPRDMRLDISPTYYTCKEAFCLHVTKCTLAQFGGFDRRIACEQIHRLSILTRVRRATSNRCSWPWCELRGEGWEFSTGSLRCGPKCAVFQL